MKFLSRLVFVLGFCAFLFIQSDKITFLPREILFQINDSAGLISVLGLVVGTGITVLVLLKKKIIKQNLFFSGMGTFLSVLSLFLKDSYAILFIMWIPLILGVIGGLILLLKLNSRPLH